MKSMVISLKLSLNKIIFVVVLVIVIIIGQVILVDKKSSVDINNQTVSNSTDMRNDNVNIDKVESENIEKVDNISVADILKEYKGFRTLGKINIPKIGLDTYILDETNDKSLAVSVTKLSGPLINTQGNFCIAGHNYTNKNMFGKINKLELGDVIYIYDLFDRKVEYKVTDIYTTNPKDVSCIKYDNSGNRQITLITCTPLAIKRLIVRAENVYEE